MSGIALIIPGADFSDSPLGQVTFSKTIAERAAEVVDAYATEIGSHTYDAELTTLVTELMRIGVWETINVFPMLGDTVAKKVISLNRGEDAVVNGLAYPDTVVIDNNELLFTNGTINPTLINGNTSGKNVTTIGLKQGFSFIDLQRGSDTYTYSYARNNYIAIMSDANSSGVGKPLKIVPPSAVKSSFVVPISLNNRHSVAVYIKNKIQVYVDNVKKYEDTIGDTSTSYEIYNGIGYSGLANSKEFLWDGYIRMVAFGTIEDETKAKDTVDALQIFLDAVKPRN